MSSNHAIAIATRNHLPASKALGDRVLAPGDDPGIVNCSDVPPGVIQRLMATVHEERAHLPGHVFKMICDQILDLGGLTRRDQPGPVTNGHRAKVETDIRRYIHQHAGDADLDVTVVAQALGWSVRYIQQVLQAAGTTARALIRHERLQLARARLVSPTWALSTIAQISHSSGFSSHATFATAFRKEFGMTPTEARRPGNRAGE